MQLQSTSSQRSINDVLEVFQREVALQCRYALVAAADLNAALQEMAAIDDETGRLMDAHKAEIEERQRTRPSFYVGGPRTQEEWDALEAWENRHLDTFGYMAHHQRLRERHDAADLRAKASIQALLTAAANISKLFDPPPSSRPTSQQRGTALKTSLGLDSTPLPNVSNRRLRDAFEHIDEKLDELHTPRKTAGITTLMDWNFGPAALFDVGASQDTWYRRYDPQTTHLTFWASVAP